MKFISILTLAVALATSATAEYIQVTTWSAAHCVGTSQGTTSVGTSGKCVNMSNAGSIAFGLAENPSGGSCTSGTVKYYRNTGCGGTEYAHGTWTQTACTNLGDYVHGSALYKCTG